MDPPEQAPQIVLTSTENHEENERGPEGYDIDLPEDNVTASGPSSHSSSFLVGSSGSEFSNFLHLDEDEENEESPVIDKKYLVKLRKVLGEPSETVIGELLKQFGSYEEKKLHEKKMEKLSKMLGETAESLKSGEGKTPPTPTDEQHQKKNFRHVVGKLMRATRSSHSSSPASKDSASPLTPKSPIIKIGEMEIEPGSLQEKIILDLIRDKLLEVEREEELQKYTVAFSVKRGECGPPCDCPQYISPTTDPNKGGNCMQCGHYPAQHKNLGLISNEPKADFVNGLKNEIEAISRVRSQSLYSPTKEKELEKRSRGLTEFGSPSNSAFRRVKEDRIPSLKLDFSSENSNGSTPPTHEDTTDQAPVQNNWVSAVPYGSSPRSSSSANATPRSSNPSTPRTSNAPPAPFSSPTPRTSNPATPRTSNPTPVVTPRNSNPPTPSTPRNSNPPTPSTPRTSSVSRPGSAGLTPSAARRDSTNLNTSTEKNVSPRSGFIPIPPKNTSPETSPPEKTGGLLSKFRSLSPTAPMLKRQGSLKTMIHSASFPATKTTSSPPSTIIHGFSPSDTELETNRNDNNNDSEFAQSSSSDSIAEDMEFTKNLQRSPPSAKKGIDSLNISSSWIIDGKELQLVTKLASGSSAKVYKGIYRNQEVAIKVLKTQPEGKQLEDFKKEFEIMSCLRSPNVVYFYGTVLTPKVCIVMVTFFFGWNLTHQEYCSKGSLFDVLKDENIAFDWARFFKFSIEAMRGVNCLHSWKPQIVHRDLKSLNLLIDENWICKLADFGTSRFMSGKQSTLGKVRGTYAYCCPEVYFGEPFTAKSDIYSYGIILWEMIVRVIRGSYERPFSEYPEIAFDFQIILQSAKHHLRPKIPQTCPEALADLVQSCWASQPENRLDSKEVLERLLDLQKTYEKEPKPWNKAIEKKKRRFSIVGSHN